MTITSLAILVAAISVVTTMTIVQADTTGDTVNIDIPQATLPNTDVVVNGAPEYSSTMPVTNALLTFTDGSNGGVADMMIDATKLELAITNPGVGVHSGIFNFPDAAGGAIVTFTDTGDDVVISGQAHSIWKKEFPAGTITLGGNEGAGNSSMYTVKIVGQGNDVDTIQPSTPTSLKAKSSTNKMDLSWNASTDNVGVTGYRIYRDGIQVADVSSITYQDTGLSKNTTYVYTVSAYDTAGNESSQSAPLVSDTKPPGRPSGMKIVGT